MSQQPTYDALVIGGGIVGASAAYNLARAGAKTLLIDSRDPGRATDAGAGIITPETSGTGLPVAWFPLAIAAGAYYPVMIDQLREDDAGDTGYQVCGELIVAADEDELDAWETKRRIVFQRQQERGLPSADDLHEIAPDDARAMFPALKTVLKAIYFRGGARVDGRLLDIALLNAARKRGLTVLNQRVDRLLVENGAVVGVMSGGSRIEAGKVIIAGGAWSSSFGETLGCTIRVEPQRGQIIHLKLDGVNTGDWPVIEAFHGHYLVAWPDGRVVAGATREVQSSFETGVTAIGIHEVLGEALRVAPGLGAASIADIRVGLRPRTVDNLPVLGDVPGVANVYLATGHGANGLQLGSVSGKLAADWALGLDCDIDTTAFHVSRWSQP